jgi:hypothetical protein
LKDKLIISFHYYGIEKYSYFEKNELSENHRVLLRIIFLASLPNSPIINTEVSLILAVKIALSHM